MANPVLVLIHGANHQSIHWQPTIDVLATIAPDSTVLAVDLPGRGGVPIDLEHHDLDACAAGAVDQIDASGHRSVPLVLVGHSLGGLVATQVAIALGPSRVERLVLVAATIPPEGSTVARAMGGIVRLLAPVTARRRTLSSLPSAAAKRGFCNDMTPEQEAFVLDHLCPDATFLVREPVTYVGLSPAIARTWVVTTNDKMVPARQQARSFAVLGGIDDVVEIAAGHDMMISRPTELAEVVADRATRSP